VIAGTMTGEEAVRASYESAIGLAYETKTVEPMAYVLGIDADDVVKNIATIASTKTK
jgi:predicted fused transcriptional regulator/phosphomethylpyrimidine kinase